MFPWYFVLVPLLFWAAILAAVVGAVLCVVRVVEGLGDRRGGLPVAWVHRGDVGASPPAPIRPGRAMSWAELDRELSASR